MGEVWGDINGDLLLTIAKYTTTKDHIVLRTVCRAWGSVLSSDDTFPTLGQQEQQLPWGLFPCRLPGRCLLYSLSEQQQYLIDLPEFYRYRCCGSSHGWLIFADNTPAMFMLNPLTRRRIELPPITTIFINGSFIEYDESNTDAEYGYTSHTGRKTDQPSESMKKYGFAKVILTGNPSLEKDYFVILLSIQFAYLGICREGDDKWRRVDLEGSVVHDIVHCGGSICYTMGASQFNTVSRLDLNYENPSVTKILTQSNQVIRPLQSFPSIVVTSGNNVLLLNRMYDEFFPKTATEDDPSRNCFCFGCGSSNEYDYDDDDDPTDNEEEENHDSSSTDHEESDEDSDDIEDSDDDDDESSSESSTEEEEEDQEDNNRRRRYRTDGLVVYMLNTETGQVRRVRSIGGHALFLGNTPPMVVPASQEKNHQVCKPNHVYFMGYNTQGFMGNDMGVMHIKTNKRRPFPGCSKLANLITRSHDIPTAVWFNPSLY